MQTAAFSAKTIIEGRYEILGTIAQGSMGTVYKARQLKLDRLVAVKVLHLDQRLLGDTDDHHRRFLYEASTLSRLNHPNTVRVFDYGIWNSQPFLVMEFVVGRSLSALLEQGISPLRAIRIARQVCQSLGEAHQRGLVHRDLKPANLLITDEGGADIVKVVDFGLVKEVDDPVAMTGDGVLLGTPLYMSPEQIRGEPIDQRCDIYAIGVLLYQCIAGRPPFQETQVATLLMAHLHDTPTPFATCRPDLDLPECIEWTIMHCLEKDRDRRFHSVEELERALKICEVALLKPELTTAMTLRLNRGHMTVSQSRSTTKHYLAATLIAAAALLLGVFLANNVQPDTIHIELPAAPAFLVEDVELPQPATSLPDPAPTPAAQHPRRRRPRSVVPTAPTAATAAPAPPPARVDVQTTDLRNPFETE